MSPAELFDVPQTPKYRAVREALAAIDSMMVLPAVPTIPIQIVSIVHEGSAGAYARQRGGALRRIEIAEGADLEGTGVAAMTTTLAEEVLERNALEVAAIAGRIGASEEEVRQALAAPEAVRMVMHKRQLSEDHAIFLLVANIQAHRRRDAIVTVPA